MKDAVFCFADNVTVKEHATYSVSLWPIYRARGTLLFHIIYK